MLLQIKIPPELTVGGFPFFILFYIRLDNILILKVKIISCVLVIKSSDLPVLGTLEADVFTASQSKNEKRGK